MMMSPKEVLGLKKASEAEISKIVKKVEESGLYSEELVKITSEMLKPKEQERPGVEAVYQNVKELYISSIRESKAQTEELEKKLLVVQLSIINLEQELQKVVSEKNQLNNDIAQIHEKASSDVNDLELVSRLM